MVSSSVRVHLTQRLRPLQRFCSDFGGSLASVRDIWEYNFLQRIVRSAGHAFAWIGGYRFEVSSLGSSERVGVQPLPGQIPLIRRKSTFKRDFFFRLSLKCDRRCNFLICLQGEWRWEDGSAFNYRNWDTEVDADQYQCLQLNSQGRTNRQNQRSRCGPTAANQCCVVAENVGWTNNGCGNFMPFVCQVKPNC